MTPLYACTRGPGCMPHKLSVYHEVYLRFRVNVRMRRQFMKWSLQLTYIYPKVQPGIDSEAVNGHKSGENFIICRS